MKLIQFFNADKKVNLSNRKKLKLFLTALLQNEAARDLIYVSYIFCSDKYLLEINRKFLQHDFYTDIITFDISSNQETLSGEVYISVDRVKENAKIMGASFKEELHRVIFHGALHLCGFNDKSKSEKTEMRKMENQTLKKYFK